MWFSSKSAQALICLLALLTLSVVAGCMNDKPGETDMPWSAPASWEGTMPLPSGYMDRYQ